MNWSHGHNQTIHNGISRIGFYTGGQAARFRDEDLGDEWVARSKEWIAANRERPFFLFFSSHDIHVPRIPHERFQGRTKLGFRGDSIAEFDWCVGEILETLDRLGLTDRTLVVLCSDNGPVLDDGYVDGAVEQLGNHDPAGPFSGGKYGVLEGGTRIPFITRWPGRIQPGLSEEVVCTVDLAASFAALAGTPLPEQACLDSFNLLPALLGEPGAPGRDQLLQQDNNGTNLGLRVGDWKLIRQRRSGSTQARVSRKSREENRGLHQLYYLPDDPSETKDLATREPDRLNEMIATLDKLIAAGRSRN